MSASGWAAGLLLVIAGIWLLLQTLVGDLPARIVKLPAITASNPSSGDPAAGLKKIVSQSAAQTSNTAGQSTNPATRQALALDEALGLQPTA